jgi:hypothetical protein
MATAYSNSAMDDRLKKIKGDVYQAQAVSDRLPEYDYARKKAIETVNQSNSSAQDALKRRFAAMGALNSGSSIKQQQLQQETAMRAKADAIEGINAQEAQAKRALQQQEAERAFQSGEAARGRAFGAEEGELGRQFQSGEAQLGREFQAGESQKARELQQSMFNSDLEFKRWSTALQNDTALKQLKVDIFNSAINAAANYDEDKLGYYLNHFVTQGQERGLYL